MQRYLDPSVLAGISGLDLVAKTVVDGFVAGLHRSLCADGPEVIDLRLIEGWEHRSGLFRGLRHNLRIILLHQFLTARTPRPAPFA